MLAIASLIPTAIASGTLAAGWRRRWAPYCSTVLFFVSVANGALLLLAARPRAPLWIAIVVGCDAAVTVIGLVFIVLVLAHRTDGRGGDDAPGWGDDGGPPERPSPPGPSGEPVWWPEFEQAFRRHVAGSAGPRPPAPARPVRGRRARQPRTR